MAVPPGPVTLKLAVLFVKGSIASLKVALMVRLIATAVAPPAGTVELTVGGVVSGVAAVVKFQPKSVTSALPARSLAPRSEERRVGKECSCRSSQFPWRDI